MRVEIPGNHRPTRPDREVFARSNAGDRMEVTVKLRPRAIVPAGSSLSREEFADRHGASESDVLLVRLYADQCGLKVASSDSAERKVVLSGTVAAMEGAFGVELHDYAHPTAGIYRGHPGPVTVPEALADVVAAVFGLDDRPQAKPHFRMGWQQSPQIRITNRMYRTYVSSGEIASEGALPDIPAQESSAPPGSFTPPELAKLYGFPEGYHGWGQTIAIIELGGGFLPSDLSAYFGSLGISPAPQVVAASVDGARNTPGADADVEVTLDIQVAGSVAPKAKIVVYFAPNTDRGFIDAISAAVFDRAHRPSVISISWGGPEVDWTPAAMAQLDATLSDAAALGVTVLVAAGDNGSSDGVSDGKEHVDFPASSPHAIACGGTRLVASGGKIESETVWNDGAQGGAGGGGFSATFARPSWQSTAHTGRGVPDVAANADPRTGYAILVRGKRATVGGTSAVAPLLAGLVALANEINGKPAGLANARLYSHAAAFRDVTAGNNGAYTSGPSWDAASGLGSPIGAAVVAALKG